MLTTDSLVKKMCGLV